MEPDTITGIVASILTATASIPQLIKIIRNKEAKDISLLMVTVLILGLATWIVYGILKEDIIIIVANAIPCVVNEVVLIVISLGGTIYLGTSAIFKILNHLYSV